MAETSNNFDPHAFTDALKKALANPSLELFAQPDSNPSPQVCAAAWAVALALGRCRLFGVDPSAKLTEPIPGHVAAAAAQPFVKFLESWIYEAQNLGAAWDNAADDLAGLDRCLNLLQARLDAWAAYLAIDEAYASALEDDPSAAEEMAPRIRSLLEGQEQLDRLLRQEAVLLSVVVATPFLENTRRRLAVPFRDMPPWWLDGTLEEISKKLDEELKTRPGRVSLAPSLYQDSWGWLRSELVMAARVARPADEPMPPTLHWRSPDQVYEATLYPVAEKDASGATVFQFNLFRHGEPATELAGRHVTLGGASAIAPVNSAGCAFFGAVDLELAKGSGANAAFSLEGAPWDGPFGDPTS